MKKIGDIAPWSFYRNQVTAELPLLVPQQPTPQKPPQKGKQKYPHNEIKDFKKLNQQNAKSQPRHKAPSQANNPESYYSIISTSAQMISTRDQDIDFNNRYLILVALHESLRMEGRDREVKRTKEKYECLFPILKPRESLKLKHYRLLKSEYPSQMLYHDLVSSIPDFS